MAPSNRIQQWHLTMAPRPSNSIPPWHGTQQWHDSQKGRHHGPPFLEVRTLTALAIWENISKIDQCEGFVNHCYFVTIGWLLLHGYPTIGISMQYQSATCTPLGCQITGPKPAETWGHMNL